MKPPHAILTLRPKPMGHNGSPIVSHRASPAVTDAVIEFGRFRVLPRERRLMAGGEPIELGARAFDLLMVLIEADGALVIKDELQSRVWPGIIVGQDNLKVQIAALRKALGQDREFVRTEHGRGYRFTATVRDTLPTPECWLARVASTQHNPLIIDELGFVPLSKTGAELLFEPISQRYERGATLITSNLPFDEWTETSAPSA